MSFVLISWNLQRINEQKVISQDEDIGFYILQTLWACSCERFILFVYENKAKPEEVTRYIWNGIEKVIQKHKLNINLAATGNHFINVGGDGSTKENILMLWNGLQIMDCQNLDCTSEFEARYQNHIEVVNRDYMARREGKRATPSIYSRPIYDPFVKPGIWHRNPVGVILKSSEVEYRIAALHAPGPDFMNDEILGIYLKKAKEYSIELFAGDFNTPSIKACEDYGWREVKCCDTGTTYNHTSTKLGSTKWDRILVRESANISITQQNSIEHKGRDISDHVALYGLIEKSSYGAVVMQTLNKQGEEGAIHESSDKHEFKDSMSDN